ncbi:alpha/beta hydrolase [soil metagenome]
MLTGSRRTSLGANRNRGKATAALVAALLLATSAASAAVEPLCTPGLRVNEEKFVSIGGIEQWITIKGERCENPIILFLHGGPGNALSPYADAMFGHWTHDFTLVQWDQRGAGRTFGKNPETASAPLTLEQMTRDGLAVAEYVSRRAGNRKVILTGGSWGSILGVMMAKARPELFEAYLGVAHVVNKRENQAATYEQVLALARAAADEESTTALTEMGAPPWKNPRSPGIVRRITRKYEGQSTVAAPAAWTRPAADYASPEALAEAEAADDYSFVQFVGMNDDGMFSKVDLPAMGLEFSIPLYFLHGAQDLVTVPEIARRYFDSITAPDKAFVLVPEAGHDPNAATVDAMYRLLKTRLQPLLKR